MTPAIQPGRLPAGWLGQILAVALTLATLALVWFTVGAPLLALYVTGRSDLAQRRMLLARMADAVASLPSLQQKVVADVGATTKLKALLDGSTDATAGATLQLMVEEIARREGANLPSIATLPATRLGAYRRIGLRLSVTAPLPVLLRLLLDVERETPSILVDDLEIHGVRITSQSDEPPLPASFTVYAFRAAPPPAAKSDGP